MLAFLAIVIAVIALIVASGAKRRVAELELELQTLRPRVEPTPAPPPAPVPEPQIPIYQPPPPTQQPSNPATQQPVWSIDWENLVGIKLFSWIAGIALVLAAVFLFKYSVEHGWLRPPIRAGIGLISGIALLVLCELRVARNYRFTANAMDGAGIAILYATLFSMHAVWQLVPAAVSFLGMLIVTAAAVYLSTRRDSVFIALLGLIGGFATPALLSSGENRPIALFSYLLLLNGGISWIAFKKRWPLLTALSVALTVFYQWAWVSRFLTTGQLPLAAGIFILFAVVGASALFPRGAADQRQPLFRRIAAAAAVVPLIFAFFTAIVPEYGRQYHVLFGFLLLMAAGLAAIAILRGPEWLHGVGAVATLVTWFVWLTASYTPLSWPWSLVWLAVFVALYLAAALRLRNGVVHTAGLLFFVFIALAVRESRDLTLIGAMLALLTVVVVFSIMRKMPHVASIAIALSSIATMVMSPGLRADLLTQAVMLAALMAIAWLFELHWLLILAVPFYGFAILTAGLPTGDSQLMYAGALFAMFVIYGYLRRAPAAAVFASVIFFIAGADALDRMQLADWQGVFAVSIGVVMMALLWRTLIPYVGAAAIAYFTIAIPQQFNDGWIMTGLALEAAALAWLYTRVRHRGLLAWSAALAFIVLMAFAADPVVAMYGVVYVVCAAAMYFSTWIAPQSEENLRRLYASVGTIELFFLLNVVIADYYSPTSELTFNFMSSSLAQDLTYTMAWALFALTMLVTGIVLGTRGARVAALGLLLITILKCFLHDLARLGGLYRVASLFGLAVSLVLVGLMLQKFVMMKRESQQPTA